MDRTDPIFRGVHHVLRFLVGAEYRISPPIVLCHFTFWRARDGVVFKSPNGLTNIILVVAARYAAADTC